MQTAARYLLPLQLLFSVFLLLRGHNSPGGGFVAGLVVAAAFSLYAVAYDQQRARRLLRVEPFVLVGAGLLTALASGLIGLAQGAFMTGEWLDVELPWISFGLGTPLLFDLGVYLTVAGVALKIVFTLME